MRKRIVIVDGNPEWRRFSTEVLESEGYDIKSFVDMEQALRYVVANDGDLIVADYARLRGQDATSFRQLRRIGYTDRLLFFVRTRNPRTLRECFRLGALDCVLKPRTKEALSSIVNEAIQHRSHLAVAGGATL